MLIAIAYHQDKYWGNYAVSWFLKEFPGFKLLVKKLKEVDTDFVSALFFLDYSKKPVAVSLELKVPFGSVGVGPKKLKKLLKAIKEDLDVGLSELQETM